MWRLQETEGDPKFADLSLAHEYTRSAESCGCRGEKNGRSFSNATPRLENYIRTKSAVFNVEFVQPILSRQEREERQKAKERDKKRLQARIESKPAISSRSPTLKRAGPLNSSGGAPVRRNPRHKSAICWYFG